MLAHDDFLGSGFLIYFWITFFLKPSKSFFGPWFYFCFGMSWFCHPMPADSWGGTQKNTNHIFVKSRKPVLGQCIFYVIFLHQFLIPLLRPCWISNCFWQVLGNHGFQHLTQFPQILNGFLQIFIDSFYFLLFFFIYYFIFTFF